jgi:hypothetical protein
VNSQTILFTIFYIGVNRIYTGNYPNRIYQEQIACVYSDIFHKTGKKAFLAKNAVPLLQQISHPAEQPTAVYISNHGNT